MDDILNLYCSGVLDVIERELKKQRELVFKKGIFVNKHDKEYLHKLEQLWYEKLLNFEKLIEEEEEFYKNFNN